MLNPLTPMTFAGMLYYQGESDILRNTFYQCALPALIVAWRERAGTEVPLVLAMTHPFPYIPEDIVYLPQMRLNQAAFPGVVPAMGVAVSTDLGDREFPYNALHPHNKTAIATRMADVMSSLRHGTFEAPSTFLEATHSVYLGQAAIRLQANGPIVLDDATVTCPEGDFVTEPWQRYCATMVLVSLETSEKAVPTRYVLGDDGTSLLAVFDDGIGLAGELLVQYCIADWPVPVAYDHLHIPVLPAQFNIS